MDIKLFRTEFSSRSTIGELFVDDRFECFTLEDVVRPVKIKGETAIPAGTYEVVISFSQRFKRPLPLLLKVPNFEGIRIHPGNTDADTDGCVLVGTSKRRDAVANSRVAFKALFDKLVRASATQKIFIEVAERPTLSTLVAQPQGALESLPVPSAARAPRIRRRQPSARG